MSGDNLRQRSVQAVAWTVLQGWGGQLISFAVYAVLARLLDPEAFGLVAMALVFIAFTQVFVDQGMAAALIQRKDIEPAHLNTMFWTNLGSGALLMGAGWLAADSIAALYRQPALGDVLRWLSVVLLINSLSSVHTALLRRHLNFRPLALRGLAGLVCGGVVGVCMAYAGTGVWSLVAQQLTNAVVQLILLWHLSRWRPGVEWRLAKFRELFAYGSNVLGINLLEFFNRYADNFLIGYFLGPVALGYYTLAYKLYQTLSQLITGITQQVAFSSFSRFQDDPPRVRRAFYAVVELAATVSFPIFLGTALLAAELFPFLFGDQWRLSITVFQVLALVGMLECVFLYNGSVMLAMGKPHWRLRLNLINALFNVIGFAIAVHYGIVYVALAYVLRSYLLSPLPLWCVQRLTGITAGAYFNRLAVPLLAAGVMLLCVHLVRIHWLASASFPVLAAGCALVGGIVYALLLYLVRPELIKGPIRLVKGLRG